MKKLIIILISTFVVTAIGLYLRPSLAFIGQIGWWNVLTKGYFLGSVEGFFSQGFIDRSFWFVMRFTGAGILLGILIAFLAGGKSSGAAHRKK